MLKALCAADPSHLFISHTPFQMGMWRRADHSFRTQLDVNPDVYVWEEKLTNVDAVDFGPSSDIKMTDLDFDMVVDSTMCADMLLMS